MWVAIALSVQRLTTGCTVRGLNPIGGEIKVALKQATKTQCGGVQYSSTLSLTSTLDGVGGQRHDPAALYPLERPDTHFTGGWVGPRAGLDGRKISSPPGFDPGPSSP